MNIISNNGILQIIALLSFVVLLAKPLGFYIATVYQNNYYFKYIGYIEQKIYKICNVIPEQPMNWKEYATAMLGFNCLGFLVSYLILRLQFFLPLNPYKFINIKPDIAFNTAISVITNTNWQAYIPETTLSYLTQMLVTTVQNFASAATGMSILIALTRGFARQETTNLGNFWVDLIRGVIYIFMPLCLILSILLVLQGVPQNFKSEGPINSLVAIKQLGTNGGGFFKANAAHPLENPTPIANFLEMLAIILVPTALCYTFGFMVNNLLHGKTLLKTMLLVLIPCILIASFVEQNFGSLIGKEIRIGELNSGLWTILTTATSNGSLNAILDSLTPYTKLLSLWLMDSGEIFLGGLGSGVYQMLIFVIITVFVCGLMIGKTPEYLGKKIESFEIKMVSFAVLVMPSTVLLSSALFVANNPDHIEFTKILYAFSSMANNNGSALGELNFNAFYNTLGGVVMLTGRYLVAVPMLALAGSLAKKKLALNNQTELPINGAMFIIMLIAVIFIIAALVFLPAFSLGPIIECL